MSAPDYKALRANTRKMGARKYSEDISKARRKEQTNRAANASTRAKTVLSLMYPDDYQSLYEQAKAEVAEERGPLPGDK